MKSIFERVPRWIKYWRYPILRKLTFLQPRISHFPLVAAKMLFIGGLTLYYFHVHFFTTYVGNIKYRYSPVIIGW
jgi:hypothetical protein